MKTSFSPRSVLAIATALTALAAVRAQDPDHRWTFNNTLNNSGTEGLPHAQLVDPDGNELTGGGAVQNANSITLLGGGSNQSNFIDLGPFLLSSAPGDVTIELWATPLSVQNWSRAFDFGNRVGDNGEDYIFMSWSIGTNGAQDRVEWRDVTPDVGGSVFVDNTNAPYALGTEYHLAMNIRPGAGAGGSTVVTWYSAPSGDADLGPPQGSFETINSLASLNDVNGWLGRSQWAGDNTANATYNEMRIFYRNVTSAELEGYHDLGPDSIAHVDADGDGLPAWWEEIHGLDDNDDGSVNPDNGPSGNPDGDSADNAAEFAAGTDPQNPLSNPNDTDADGLDDAWELLFFGNLAQDGDGDPDFDGSRNEAEETDGTDPLDPFSWADADGDGLPDDYEIQVWGNTTTANATSDSDGDTYTDVEEYEAGTDPDNGNFSPAKAELIHRWTFNSNDAAGLMDLVGGSNAQILDADNNAGTGGGASLDGTNPGQLRLFGGPNSNDSNYVLLGNNLIGGTTHDITIELWATQHGVQNWSRIWSFGTDTTEVLFQAWTRGTFINQSRVEFRDGPLTALDTDQAEVFPLGVEHHIVVQLDHDGAGGTQMTLWKDPSSDPDLGPVTTTVFAPRTLADLVDSVNWLGRSQFGGDGTANASYNEVRIYRGLVHPQVREVLHDSGPDDADVPDSDGDGLPDFWEIANGLDPNDATGANGAFGDPDNDGMVNRDEYAGSTNPTDASDSDGDGLDDQWELDNFGDLSQSGSDDPDGDGVSNEEEETAGTDPNDMASFPDGDGDGLPDAYEIAVWGNTTTSSGTSDTDGDTYTDIEEFFARTPPDNPNYSPAWAELIHRWNFNGNLNDSVGGSTAQVIDPDGNIGTGGGSDLDGTNPGELRLFGGAFGETDYIQLGTNLIGGAPRDITIELWATQHGIQNWSRVFDFGSGIGEFVMLSWSNGTNANAVRLEQSTPQQAFIDIGGAPVFPLGVEHHIVVQLDSHPAGNMTMTVHFQASADADLGPADGTVTATLNLASLDDAVNWLGRSQFANDNTANASYNEARIYEGLVSPLILERLHDQGPDDPEIVDADGDFLPDFWEVAHGLSSASAAGDDGAFGDPDDDGFNNRDEYAAGSDPNDSASTPEDTDADGLPDAYELLHFGSLDQDGAGDFDMDCDTNLEEFLAGTDPNNSGDFTDTDGDFLPDSWELKFFGDLSQDQGGDSDGDGLGNLDEFQRGTNPNLADTDGDGLEDGVETGFGFYNGPTDTGTDPLNPDTDGDGLSDGVEDPTVPFVDINQPGTDPNFFDTDGDGFGDLLEIENGSDPTDFDSIPVVVWHWDHTTLANGPVMSWVDKNQGVNAGVLSANHGDPSKDAGGVFFDGNDALTIQAADNPLGFLFEWSATAVIRADGTMGEGGGTQADGNPNDPEQWWGSAALVGVELPGNPIPSDWGVMLNSESEAVIGSGGGAAPQGFVADGTALNDGATHVVTGTFDVSAGIRALYVDGVLINESAGVGVNFAGGPIHFGVNIPDVPADRAYYTGRITDVLLHSVALDAGEAAALANELLTGGIAALVDVGFDAGGNTVTLTYAGLTAGNDYHVRVTTDGQTYTPVPGAEFNAAATEGTFQFTSNEQVTPLQIFRIFQGQSP